MDINTWEFFDLSCKARDDTNDQVLKDAVTAGKRVCSIFKEPTITPTAQQVKSLGLRKAWGSPNGAMRRGWNGITISRDTIHIEGVKLGFERPVLFEVPFLISDFSLILLYVEFLLSISVTLWVVNTVLDGELSVLVVS